MSQAINITVKILDENHTLSCEPHERALLLEAVQLLNNTLKEIRSNARIAPEKLMILAGVHLAFQLLQEQKTLAAESQMVNQMVQGLANELNQAISAEEA